MLSSIYKSEEAKLCNLEQEEDQMPSSGLPSFGGPPTQWMFRTWQEMLEGQCSLNNKFGKSWVRSQFCSQIHSEMELWRAPLQDQSWACVFDPTKYLGLRETTATQGPMKPHWGSGREKCSGHSSSWSAGGRVEWGRNQGAYGDSGVPESTWKK